MPTAIAGSGWEVCAGEECETGRTVTVHKWDPARRPRREAESAGDRWNTGVQLAGGAKKTTRLSVLTLHSPVVFFTDSAWLDQNNISYILTKNNYFMRVFSFNGVTRASRNFLVQLYLRKLRFVFCVCVCLLTRRVVIYIFFFPLNYVTHLRTTSKLINWKTTWWQSENFFSFFFFVCLLMETIFNCSIWV